MLSSQFRLILILTERDMILFIAEFLIVFARIGIGTPILQYLTKYFDKV